MALPNNKIHSGTELPVSGATMPEAGFFSKLGVFVVSDFLDNPTCSQIIQEIDSAAQNHSTVLDDYDRDEKVNQRFRKTNSAEVSRSVLSLVYDRLLYLRQDLGNHFHMKLHGCEDPQFLVYGEGAFFRPHADRDDSPKKPEYVRKRKVSAIMFLNNEASEKRSGDYEGGSLVLYGLIGDPRWEKYGFQLGGKAGVLIAFPSSLIHEVMPVTRGKRYSIVNWFF